MSYGCEAYCYAQVLAECSKYGRVELGAVVGDDILWHPIPENYAFPYEALRCRGRDFGDWLGLDPSGEIFDGNEREAKAAPGCWVWSDYVEPPLCEGSHKEQGLQRDRRCLCESAGPLAPLAALNEILRVSECGWPVEALAEGFTHEAPGRLVCAAEALVDVFQEGLALFLA